MKILSERRLCSYGSEAARMAVTLVSFKLETYLSRADFFCAWQLCCLLLVKVDFGLRLSINVGAARLRSYFFLLRVIVSKHFVLFPSYVTLACSLSSARFQLLLSVVVF